MILNSYFLAVALLSLVGFYALVFRSNMIKITMGLAIIASAVNLFLISLGYRYCGIAPIFTDAPIDPSQSQLKMVLPVPQALTLTSIVISLAVTALMLSLSVLLYRKTKSLDIRDIKEALSND
ncbi:MAG: cation:proton antiporter subunit C [Candidatus Diapherotrites archaeon]|nr:cation:proton antiporter subunit C [Candidatus Diapherotrites archaeon]